MDPLPPIDRKVPVAHALPAPLPASPPVRGASDGQRPGDPPRRSPREGDLLRALGSWPQAVGAALRDGRSIGVLVEDLVRALAALAARTVEGERRAWLEDALDRVFAHLVAADVDGPGLAHRARTAGPFEEAREAAARAAGVQHAQGLKGLASELGERLDADPERRAALALAGGLEREQWLELLRRELGEPRRIALPWFDAGRFGTLELLWPRAHDAPGAPGAERGGRIAFELDLGRLGRARADLALAAGRLVVGLAFEDTATLASARALAPALAARLAAHGELRLELAALRGDSGEGPAAAALREVA